MVRFPKKWNLFVFPPEQTLALLVGTFQGAPGPAALPKTPNSHCDPGPSQRQYVHYVHTPRPGHCSSLQQHPIPGARPQPVARASQGTFNKVPSIFAKVLP